jgi:hypothetical protein
MVDENPTWGAPRIHGELRMLGFDISEQTVLRWMQKAPREPGVGKAMGGISEQSPRGHRRDGLLPVPTLTFGMIYCFFVISHDRRRILHCNVTRHPTSVWVAQQLREAFPYDSAAKYLIFDRAAKLQH